MGRLAGRLQRGGWLARGKPGRSEWCLEAVGSRGGPADCRDEETRSLGGSSAKRVERPTAVAGLRRHSGAGAPRRGLGGLGLGFLGLPAEEGGLFALAENGVGGVDVGGVPELGEKIGLRGHHAQARESVEV